ncbi:nitroreductase family deazaflavin-dependent oxidoreductase [Nocardioides euryhalodurans]|uniref:Nitroreductase family deazaflavin-dependent oxidoreductase n=1 Tax=Nocardioides euryhalodurans TaxID=2518370 RepID=A0A4P7GLG4_9ACTN|nr:nitroreductase family deazaflavin-dependent oxidoreductase [Nocardioides euryhalodurans]QBR92699.1 nitroreductase family deazaflavin-dependent oxidoreductase [Nocardioides euryhalodurans]
MALTGEYEPSTAAWVRNQVAAFEASDGARANTLASTGDPIVVITSVGARSGKLRKNPVMRVEHEGAYLAVASKGGSDDDPVWAHNFRARPEVDLQDGADKATYDVRELADGPERDVWWERAVRTWPRYGTYQQKTDRLIPLFLLERRS